MQVTMIDGKALSCPGTDSHGMIWFDPGWQLSRQLSLQFSIECWPRIRYRVLPSPWQGSRLAWHVFQRRTTVTLPCIKAPALPTKTSLSTRSFFDITTLFTAHAGC